MTALLKFSEKNYTIQAGEHAWEQIRNILSTFNLDLSKVYCTLEGKALKGLEQIQSYSTVFVNIRLLGGKGGFGAKLKNQGGKKVKPNDNMFSRDANGRKLAYSTMEKQYTQFCKKKMEEDEKVNAEREKYKVMESTLKQGQSFMKLDKTYNQDIENVEKQMLTSFQIGMKKNMEKKNELSSVSNQSQEKKQCVQSVEEKKESVKRKRPSDEEEEQKIEEIQKKVKADNLSTIPKAKAINPQPILVKQVPMISAKDKLKSLFKK